MKPSEIERRLQRAGRPAPAPPPGLLEALRAEIPDRLPAAGLPADGGDAGASEGEAGRGRLLRGPWWAWRTAAAALTVALAGGLWWAMRGDLERAATVGPRMETEGAPAAAPAGAAPAGPAQEETAEELGRERAGGVPAELPRPLARRVAPPPRAVPPAAVSGGAAGPEPVQPVEVADEVPEPALGDVVVSGQAGGREEAFAADATAARAQVPAEAEKRAGVLADAGRPAAAGGGLQASREAPPQAESLRLLRAEPSAPGAATAAAAPEGEGPLRVGRAAVRAGDPPSLAALRAALAEGRLPEREPVDAGAWVAHFNGFEEGSEAALAARPERAERHAARLARALAEALAGPRDAAAGRRLAKSAGEARELADAHPGEPRWADLAELTAATAALLPR